MRESGETQDFPLRFFFSFLWPLLLPFWYRQATGQLTPPLDLRALITVACTILLPGMSHSDYALQIATAAAAASTARNLAESIPLREKLLSIIDPGSTLFVITCVCLARELSEAGRELEALVHTERAIAVARTFDAGAALKVAADVGLSAAAAGRVYLKLGRPVECMAAFQCAAANFEMCPTPSKDAVGCLTDLAEASLTCGQFDSATTALRSAKTLIASLPNGKTTFADVLARHASLAASITSSRRDGAATGMDALAARRDAQSQLELRYGACSQEAASGLVCMGSAYTDAGHFNEAAATLAAAERVFALLGTSDTLEYSLLLSNQCRLCGWRGDYELALQYGQRALALQRKLLPPRHPGLETITRGISIVLTQLGRHDEAAVFSADALVLRRRSQLACAGPGCKLRARDDGAPLDVCVSCRRTSYCGKACQTADWKAGHRKECKALAAEAAAAAAATTTSTTTGGSSAVADKR